MNLGEHLFLSTFIPFLTDTRNVGQGPENPHNLYRAIIID